MGNNFTKEEEDTLSESLQEEYLFQSNQILLHKATNEPCTLHKIATFSKQQSSAVQRNIQKYRNYKCQSVSNLREYYELDNTGYCSDQQKFYLIFDGGPSPNIKEEFFNRRYQQISFSPHEIESVLSCMLCGLRQYNGVFARKEIRLGLDSVCIARQKGNKLWMRDPWLSDKNNDSSKLPVNFLATYPSPEKILSSTQATMSFDEYKSDLFTIGVFGLQLYSMNFQDDLYQLKRFVDRSKINQSLANIREQRLRGGIAILLDQNPEHRLQIYHYWNILCTKAYSLSQQSKNKPPVPPKNEPIQQSYHPYPQYRQPTSTFQQNNYQNSGASNTIQSYQNKTYTGSSVSSRPAIINFNKKPNEFQHSQPNNQSKSTMEGSKNISATQRPLSFTNSFNQTPKFNFTHSPASNYNSLSYTHNSTQSFIGPSSFKNSQNNSLINSSVGMHGNSKVFFGSSNIPLSKSIVSSVDMKQPTSTATSFGVYQKPGSISDNTISFQRYSPPHSFNHQRDSIKQSGSNHLNFSPAYQKNKQSQNNDQQFRSSEPEVKESIISSLLEEDQETEEKKYFSPPHQNDQHPTSPSTIQHTPPQPIRNKNKYNSTIVQVNQQTPNESEQSDEEDTKAIEFVVEQYETGSRYEGFKKNGVRNGKGKFFYQDGGYYDGDWKNNQMHGWGKLFYEGGKLAYEGNWAHDEFHGYGKVYNDNPVELDCGFDYTNFDLLEDYWEYYEGMLANDTKQGRGRIKLSNAEVFEGDFHNDRIQGFGKFFKKDGSIVQGIWRDSRLIKVLNSADIYK